MSRTKKAVVLRKQLEAAKKKMKENGITAPVVIDKPAPNSIDDANNDDNNDAPEAPNSIDDANNDDDNDAPEAPNSIDDANNNDDDDAPEIVTSNREDIKKLRDLHEQMMLPAEKRTKKRKATKNLSIIPKVKKISEEEELDDSVLAALDGLNEKESSTRDGDNVGLTDAEDFKKMTRTLSKKKRKGIINIHARKSRKIGNIDVEVLVETENVLAAYALPKAALSFSAALTSSRPRTNFAAFSSQRHLGPCSKFTAQDRKLLPKKPA